MLKVIGSQKHIHQLDLRDFKGRVFFVTDVHGYYDLLFEELANVAFQYGVDILLSSGDWTDRGPESVHVLDILDNNWVYSTRGNHEQLFIGAVDENWEGRNTNCLLANGGQWVAELDDLKMVSIYETFKAMPLGIELLLPNGRKVGIVHAEPPYDDWDKFVEIDAVELETNGKAVAQWSRSRYDRGYKNQVKGVDFVLVGHTPTDTGNLEQLGNVVYCDAGSFFRGKLNLIELNDEFMRSIK